MPAWTHQGIRECAGDIFTTDLFLKKIKNLAWLIRNFQSCNFESSKEIMQRTEIQEMKRENPLKVNKGLKV